MEKLLVYFYISQKNTNPNQNPYISFDPYESNKLDSET